MKLTPNETLQKSCVSCKEPWMVIKTRYNSIKNNNKTPVPICIDCQIWVGELCEWDNVAIDLFTSDLLD